MLSKKEALKRIETMPDEMFKEVCDFIEFLGTKRKFENWNWLDANVEKIEDFKDYFNGLESYENMLSKGEITWK